MKTFVPKLKEITRDWHVVDAEGQVLGRLASRIASILMGKEKPTYTRFLDCGDFVIVVNAEKVRLTGKKLSNKLYYRHSGYPGGLKQMNAAEVLRKHPERLIRSAVKGMLPKNKLGRKMLLKLKIYAGGDHPHQAQQPTTLSLSS
jgi:large subunit ribosomal protein L13